MIGIPKNPLYFKYYSLAQGLAEASSLRSLYWNKGYAVATVYADKVTQKIDMDQFDRYIGLLDEIEVLNEFKLKQRVIY